MPQLIVMVQANTAEIKKTICLAFLNITLIIILYGMRNLNTDMCLRNGNKLGTRNYYKSQSAFKTVFSGWMAEYRHFLSSAETLKAVRPFFFFSNHLLLCNGLELTLGKWKINQMHFLSFHQSCPLANQVWVFLDPFPLASCIFRQWIHANNISMNAKLRITVIFWNMIKDFLWFPLSLTSLEYWKTTKLKGW